MIARLRLRGYKSFEDAEARLGSLTTILGPLSSGRTNFLEAISVLGRLAGQNRLEQAFSPPHRGRAVECFRDSEIGFEADLELGTRLTRALNARLGEREKIEGLKGSFTRVAERRLRYQVDLGLSPDSSAVRLLDESLEALSAEGKPRQRRRRFFEKDEANGRFTARIEKQDSTRYFGTARRRTVLSEVTDLVYHPHPAAAREELLGIRRYAFESSMLRSATLGAPAEGPGFHGEDLASFLSRLAAEEAQTLRRVEEQLAATGLEHIEVGAGSEVLRLRLGGDRVPFHLAPDGILHLIAITAVLESQGAPTVILLDEPERGLDRLGIATLARALRAAAASRRPATQVILTTNSIELATALEPATVLCCRRGPGRDSTLSPLEGSTDDLFRRPALELALEGRDPEPAPARTARARSRSRG